MIGEIIKEFIFPENLICGFCGADIPKDNPFGICKNCYSKIEFTDFVCHKCGRIISDNSCGCRGEKFAFDYVDTTLKYTKFIEPSVYRLKYGHQAYISGFFAEFIEYLIYKNGKKYDLITWAPVNKFRKIQRGYDQGELMAKYVSSKMKIEALKLVERTKNTPYLARISKEKREETLQNAFKICTDYDLKNKTVLLLDDIITTGATLNAVSNTIKDGFSKVRIECLTIFNAKGD